MFKATKSQNIIAALFICADRRTRSYYFLDEWSKADARFILHVAQLDASHAYCSVVFCFNTNKCFSYRAFPSVPWLPAVNVGFISFYYNTVKVVTTKVHLRSAHFVKPMPCRMITQAQKTLKPTRIGPIFLPSDMPHCPDPGRRRLWAAVKYWPGVYRGLCPALKAVEEFPVCKPIVPNSTTWTVKVIGPRQFTQIARAINPRTEQSLKFHQPSGVNLLPCPFLLHIVIIGLKCIVLMVIGAY